MSFQFQIEAFLKAGHPYILVVTTHGNADTGSFLISATGPASVDLMSITPTTSQPMIIPSIVPTTSSSYSSSLSSSSGVFQRVSGDPEYYYYYQAIQVTVSTSGTYTFTTDSDLDTMGFFYDTSFDPSIPTENLVTDDDDGGDIHSQFLIEAFLEAGHTYILVVTTHGDSQTGNFVVSAGGPDSVNLVSITPTTSQPITMPTTEPSHLSSYSSELTSNSAIFYRVDGDSESTYHYQAIQVTVSISEANGPDSVNLVSITPSTSRPITAVPTEPFVSSSLPTGGPASVGLRSSTP
ncbi:unnamed protein product [Rotaria sordida]|uniref:Uncharacterized protein n=1 Tax=Rotaria sordida TaxID=392033 RepID=A0A814MRW2_9BILA|nr:unnamed protein product [Rotaria sordida]